jgi:S-DNA-T family DNA segregation ATPase FtsK/SpoIIIE
MAFYTDEFLSAKPGSFEKKEFNVGADQSLETEVSESLNAFGIRGKVIGSESGPYITRVYFKLDRGVRFTSIEPLTDDLKMSLGTPGIKIEPDPERGAVAIEVPNAKRENIPFGNVFHANHSDLALPAALGVDPKGNPIYLDIADTPHLLIAGTTGSGKSVCLNTIISSLALNTRV